MGPVGTLQDLLNKAKKEHFAKDRSIDVSMVSVYTGPPEYSFLKLNSPLGLLRDGEVLVVVNGIGNEGQEAGFNAGNMKAKNGQNARQNFGGGYEDQQQYQPEPQNNRRSRMASQQQQQQQYQQDPQGSPGGGVYWEDQQVPEFPPIQNQNHNSKTPNNGRSRQQSQQPYTSPQQQEAPWLDEQDPEVSPGPRVTSPQSVRKNGGRPQQQPQLQRPQQQGYEGKRDLGAYQYSGNGEEYEGDETGDDADGTRNIFNFGGWGRQKQQSNTKQNKPAPQQQQQPHGGPPPEELWDGVPTVNVSLAQQQQQYPQSPLSQNGGHSRAPSHKSQYGQQQQYAQYNEDPYYGNAPMSPSMSASRPTTGPMPHPNKFPDRQWQQQNFENHGPFPPPPQQERNNQQPLQQAGGPSMRPGYPSPPGPPYPPQQAMQADLYSNPASTLKRKPANGNSPASPNFQSGPQDHGYGPAPSPQNGQYPYNFGPQQYPQPYHPKAMSDAGGYPLRPQSGQGQQYGPYGEAPLLNKPPPGHVQQQGFGYAISEGGHAGQNSWRPQGKTKHFHSDDYKEWM
jgi:hypothetical protein